MVINGFQVRVKTIRAYRATEPDELTFPMHALVRNVRRVDAHWMRGDYGGSKQAFFPAHCVTVEEEEEEVRGRGEQAGLLPCTLRDCGGGGRGGEGEG